MSSDLVLVTGVSGFLGSHVVDLLVKRGDRVRGCVRSAKLSRFQESYDNAYGTGRVEIVGIEDLIKGDFTSALKDVTAVIHVASPLSGRENPKSTLDSAIGGTTNVVYQAYKAGIKRFSIASSITAAMDMDMSIQPVNPVIIASDWNQATREQALEEGRDRYFIYGAAKALAEKAVWEFADHHPDISVTTLNPTLFIGPLAPGHAINPGDASALSTNLILYNIFIPGTNIRTPPFGFVDVRDVARGLVNGINTPGKNRMLLTGEWFDLKDAVDYIAGVRPALKNRLSNITPSGQTRALADVTKTQEVLNFKIRSWRDSVLDTVDMLIRIEREWVDHGIDIDSTLRNSDRRA